MINALEHLCDLTAHDFIIKPKQSLIFEDEEEEYTEDNAEHTKHQTNANHTKISTTNEQINSAHNIINNEQDLLNSNKTVIDKTYSRTEELLASANSEQLFLAKFFRQYLAALMQYDDARQRSKNVTKPLPFHIVINGLAGSGKSYAISIIEQMLTDFCISESAVRNRPRKRKGLLKMAHTGKAALNIHGFTIHTALRMVNFIKKIHIKNNNMTYY